jgi:long-chain acyl-CoA synthetase
VNLASIIEPHDGDKIALYSFGKPTTYGQLRSAVAALRGALAGLGVSHGDRVALLYGNKRFFVESYLATLGLGAITVPLNPTSPAAELEREISSVGAKVVFVGPTSSEPWSHVRRERVPSVQHVVAAGSVEVEGALRFDDLLRAEPVPIVDVEPDDLAVLMFTSGTVGHPQAAMLSHGNLSVNLDQILTAPDRLYHDDVVFGVLPLFHIFGLNVVLNLTLKVGATVVLVMRFDPATALDTIRERQVTVVPGAPPVWVAWSQFDEAAPSSFAGVRLALTGAARMPEPAMATLRKRFSLELREGYGLTEASPVVTSSTGTEFKPGSIGRVLDGVHVRLVDEDGDDVLLGDAGEIWVQGPNVFKGYWNDPVATARAITPEGWLRTGDIAVADEDGYLYIVDRAKDLIIVSGFNVYPAEVEEVIAEHPGVVEVAVVGVPHPHTGEAVKAYVVLEEGSEADEEQVVAWCRDHLARYKCPNKVLFVSELPKGLGGKILRRILR